MNTPGEHPFRLDRLSIASDDPWAAIAIEAAATNELLIELLPAHKPIWEINGVDSGQAWTLCAISTACLESSQGVLALVGHRQLRNAEALCRTVIEGTLRFVYSVSSHDLIGERLNEFSDALFECDRLKDHNRIDNFLRSVKTLDATQRLPFEGLLLDQASLTNIRDRFNQHERRAIKDRWSAPAIIEELTKSRFPGHEQLPTLYHRYALASHVLHVDYYGLIAMREREQRPAEQYHALDVAHAAALCDLVVACLFYRLLAGLIAARAAPEALISIQKRLDPQLDRLKELQRDFFEREYSRESTDR